MNPKEKAVELRDNMKKCLYSDGMYDANKCAMIAVDEILNINSVDKDLFLSDYWYQVKQELKKL